MSDIPLSDRIDFLDKKLDILAEAVKPKETVPAYKSWKMSWKIKTSAKKNIGLGKTLCVMLRDNSRDGILLKLPSMQTKRTHISGDKKTMVKKGFLGETRVEEGGEQEASE